MAKKTLLQILQQKQKTETRKISDKEAIAPHKGEKGAKAFLAKLPVSVAKNPSDDNEDRFTGTNVTTFDRKANRYGHDNVDYNYTDNKWQLSTSTIATEDFENAFNDFYNQVDLSVEEALEVFCEANDIDRTQFFVEEDTIFVKESDQNPAEFSASPSDAEAKASTSKQYTGGKKEGMEMQKIKLKDVLKTLNSGKYAVKE